MKTLLNFGIVGSSLAILILVLATSQYSAFGQLNSTDLTLTNTNQTQPQIQEPQLQPFTITRGEQTESTSTSPNSGITTSTVEDDKNDDIVLLSQRYNEERFGDEIVGEVMNNGTYTAEYVKVSASFYDQSGGIIGSEFTYAEPSTIRPGDRAAFTMYISSEAIEDNTERYEFTIQWNDEDFNEFSNRITGTQAVSIENDNNDSGDNDIDDIRNNFDNLRDNNDDNNDSGGDDSGGDDSGGDDSGGEDSEGEGNN